MTLKIPQFPTPVNLAVLFSTIRTLVMNTMLIARRGFATVKAAQAVPAAQQKESALVARSPASGHCAPAKQDFNVGLLYLNVGLESKYLRCQNWNAPSGRNINDQVPRLLKCPSHSTACLWRTFRHKWKKFY
ncbi:hypothetical protein BV898_04014 [Hypsibius exemplaris]|uniref:Uncharacterized protein n=1 Tax=Hypsibius exemplaris TaxID=2072580 RepID=A0A1W0X3P0_HYPEX|nr:hypothetical protein BV898_04014 [Hypsibius exemplaris]